MKTNTASPRLTSKAALAPILALLLGSLTACGGSASSTNSGGSNNNNGGGGTPLPAGTELLYVGDNVGVIHGFGVDPDSGKPTPITTTQIPIPPVTNDSTVANVALAADSGGQVLYAGVAGTGGPNVFSFIVDRKTGALSKTGSQALPVSWPVGLAAVERNLYVIAADTAQLFVFSIDPINAALTPLSPNVALPGVPHGLAIAPSGSWLGVTFEGASGGEIAWFLRSPNGGATGLQPGSPTSTGGTGAGGITVTPDGKFVVVANGVTSNVSVFSLDPGTGALSEVPGSPFATGRGPGVAIDPTGKFVFVADADNNLSAYTIDSMGSLTPVGAPIPFGAEAESIAVDPTGKFVFVGLVPREIAGFTLDRTTGALTPIAGSPFPLNSEGPTRGMVFMP
jgi:6-phosphogluconolactonase (cycloisomerase 2 family)